MTILENVEYFVSSFNNLNSKYEELDCENQYIFDTEDLDNSYSSIFTDEPNIMPFVDKNSAEKCNLTCCCAGDITVCFDDKNYSDYGNITHAAEWELALRWSFAIPTFLLGFIGNALLIIILLKNRLLLRAPVNLFILNMSVADLILSVVGPIPFTIRDTNYFWVLGAVWCKLEGYLQSKFLVTFKLNIYSF